MMRVRKLALTALTAIGVLGVGTLATSTATMAAPVPPSVDGEGFERATGNEASLDAVVNPNGQDTLCGVQYVSEARYDETAANPYAAGGTKACTNADLGAGTEDQERRVRLSGLSAGTIYHFRAMATNASGTTYGADQTFATAPRVPPVVEGESATVLANPAARLEAVVEPEGENTTYFFQYGLTSAYESGSLPEPAATIEGGSLFWESRFGVIGVTVQGLQANTTYHYRIVATNEGGTTNGEDHIFTTGAPPPMVSTGAASEITTTKAQLNGTVDPEGLATSYFYEYGQTTEYGTDAPVYPTSIEVGSGTSAVPAPQVLSPITPGTTYHYRLVATNSAGTSYGADRVFTTPANQPPAVSTGAVSGVSATGATISGIVNPGETEATYEFEYGTTTAYGSETFGSASPQQGEQNVTLSLANLQPATTYHYRLVAGNAGGRAEGSDQTFTTPGIATTLVAPATEPLLATPSIRFPTAVKPKIKPKAKPKSKKRKTAKRRRKPKRASRLRR